jgi:putative hydrolase of the HAD superfamily
MRIANSASIKVIGFDADDTLWVNEPFYQEAEKMFSLMMNQYFSESKIAKELFETEMQNLEIYGFGAKGFTLSMIETAIRISERKISSEEISRILDLGKNLLNMPIQLIDGVENVLKELRKSYKLIMATKGDLLDQERKLQKSGLIGYFHHIEIMSDKKELNYQKLLSHLDIQPNEFLMVGNSVKSDILPVIGIGAQAIHIPYEVMWQHEVHDESAHLPSYPSVSSISEILSLI